MTAWLMRGPASMRVMSDIAVLQVGFISEGSTELQIAVTVNPFPYQNPFRIKG
jgi:hypothetical protein